LQGEWGSAAAGFAFDISSRGATASRAVQTYVRTPFAILDSIRFDMFNVLGGNWDPTDKISVQ